MDKTTKNYIVFSLDLANYLIEKGVNLIKTSPSKRNKGKLIFSFPNNEKTISLVEEYKRTHSK